MTRRIAALTVLAFTGCGGGGGGGGEATPPVETVLFLDDFDRMDGTLGEPWRPVFFGETVMPTARIESSRAFAMVRSAARSADAFPATSLRVTCSFVFGAPGWAEVHVIADDDESGDNGFWVAGLDGEASEGGTLLIAQVSTDEGTLGPDAGLLPGTTYSLDVFFDGGSITLTILDASGQTLAHHSQVVPGFQPRYFGFAIGNDRSGSFTALDNFRVLERKRGT